MLFQIYVLGLKSWSLIIKLGYFLETVTAQTCTILKLGVLERQTSIDVILTSPILCEVMQRHADQLKSPGMCQ